MVNTRIRELLLAIPKVELHLHLEAALTLTTLYDFIRRSGREQDGIRSVEDLASRFNFRNFDDFISRWVWKNTFIRDERDFERIAYDMLSSLKAQNVHHLEVFYSPADFRSRGFSTSLITESILEGVRRARSDFGISCLLIADMVRDFGPDAAFSRLDEITPYREKGVVGIGLGGSEHRYPAELFTELYREAVKRGFRVVAHAGEVAGPASIWSAIRNLGVERIGHGTRAIEDDSLVEYLRERQIPLECCIISNVKLGGCSDCASHPIRHYFDCGLLVTVNSDDPLMFSSTLTDEYVTLYEHLHFSLQQIREISTNAVKASFLAPEDREGLLQLWDREWDRLTDRYADLFDAESASAKSR